MYKYPIDWSYDMDDSFSIKRFVKQKNDLLHFLKDHSFNFLNQKYTNGS